VSLLGRVREFEERTRRLPPNVARGLTRRWEELPAGAQTPAQMIGRKSAGCEGTHGVFPQCNFGCRPCYHSSDANKVRIDGTHTVGEVEEQMAFAQRQRGDGQFAQLIGGEVSLLDPIDHAAALATMRRHGRMPMSFSHGDFDYDYLEALAVGPDGARRFDEIAFAIHIDSTMSGRRIVRHPKNERELDDERERVSDMFAKLRTDHGIRSYVAHNMTVTPQNIDQVPGVIVNNRHHEYRMFSFQPAAYVGSEQRWHEGFRRFGADEVWARIEEGAGVELPYHGLQFGDLRCNRVTWGALVNDRYVPVIDETDLRDLRTRDEFFTAFPGALGVMPKPLKAVKVARSLVARPQIVPAGLGWARRFVRRSGGWRARPWQAQPLTFVMHRFMDAADVAAAWSLMKANGSPNTPGKKLGVEAWGVDPRIQETIERLSACVYSMAHPATGEMVPACVQHGVLDPEENRQLVQLLPRRGPGSQTES